MAPQRWLITGASGQLGGHVLRRLSREPEQHAILGLAGSGAVGPTVLVRHIDLADTAALRACVANFRPTHVLHLGAVTSIAACLAEPARANKINTLATQVLAQAAADVGARFVFSSTDMVFDGTRAPYRETDSPRPLSHYARTKVAAEEALEAFRSVLVVRVPLMCGLPCTRRQTTFMEELIALRCGGPLRLFTDEFHTPVWLEDAARAVIGLARSDLTGIVHIAGPQRLSRYDLIALCARFLGIAHPKLIRASRLDNAAAEPRPADLSLRDGRLAQFSPDLTPGPIRPAILSRPTTMVPSCTPSAEPLRLRPAHLSACNL